MHSLRHPLPTVAYTRCLARRPRAAPSALSSSISCPRTGTIQRRAFLRPKQSSHRLTEGLNLDRLRSESYDYHIRRRNFLLCGVAAGVIASCYTAYLIICAIRNPEKATKFDSGLPADKTDPFSTEAGSKRKTVVHDDEGREVVPTGNSTVPTFPRTLDVAVGAVEGSESIGGVEYTLVGLGVRTVSFLGIQVYMVGYYLATQDIAALQSRLVKEINPIATTLVSTEKDELRGVLLDPARGEEIWNHILRDVKPRSLFRIVPVRDTDFHHLRDGFVRAITARSQGNDAEYGDEAFGLGMKEFKTLFNRGKVPKKRELLLCRDAVGNLTVTYDDGQTGMGTIGRVTEERISRLLWLNYLAGKSVASEPARKNIVDGIMEFVERPVGTVATQVL